MNKHVVLRAPAFVISLISLLLLSSCSSPLQVSGEALMYPPGHYLAWLETEDSAVLARKRERLAHIEVPDSPVAVVQLALLLSASSLTNSKHESLAVDLIDTLDSAVASNDLEQEYLIFAGVWKQLLEQGRQLRNAQELSDTLEGELNAIRAQNRRLQEQINTLTTIERQLIEREQSQE